MDEVTLTKGQRVTYTDKDGHTFTGTVDNHRRGWVMVNLDAPVDTTYGWEASKMMLKYTDVSVIDE